MSITIQHENGEVEDIDLADFESDFSTLNEKYEYLSSCGDVVEEVMQLNQGDTVKAIVKHSIEKNEILNYARGFDFTDKVPQAFIDGMPMVGRQGYLDSFNHDKEVAMILIRYNIRVFDNLSPSLQRDRDIVLIAAGNRRFSPSKVSEELRSDKEIFIKFLTHQTHTFGYASDLLKDDREYVVLAVTGNGECNLSGASERLRNDKEVVMIAIEYNSNSLKYASARLRDDDEVATAAIKYSHTAIHYASERIKKSEHFKALSSKAWRDRCAYERDNYLDDWY